MQEFRLHVLYPDELNYQNTHPPSNNNNSGNSSSTFIMCGPCATVGWLVCWWMVVGWLVGVGIKFGYKLKFVLCSKVLMDFRWGASSRDFALVYLPSPFWIPNAVWKDDDDGVAV